TAVQTLILSETNPPEAQIPSMLDKVTSQDTPRAGIDITDVEKSSEDEDQQGLGEEGSGLSKEDIEAQPEPADIDLEDKDLAATTSCASDNDSIRSNGERIVM
ncbi:hypothetical protein FRC07_007007, partial [Ceratobasidium sp. 392]